MISKILEELQEIQELMLEHKHHVLQASHDSEPILNLGPLLPLKSQPHQASEQLANSIQQ